MAPSLSRFFTKVMTSCIPLSSAVKRSLTTSLGAVSFVVDRDTSLRVVISILFCWFHVKPEHIKSSELRSKFLHIINITTWSRWKTVRMAESSILIIIFRIKEWPCFLRNARFFWPCETKLDYFLWCRWCHCASCMSVWSIQLPDHHGLGWISIWSSSLQSFHQETVHGPLVLCSREDSLSALMKTTTWSLNYQNILGQPPAWGTLAPQHEVYLTALWSSLLCFFNTWPHFGWTPQMPHHSHGYVQPGWLVNWPFEVAETFLTPVYRSTVPALFMCWPMLLRNWSRCGVLPWERWHFQTWDLPTPIPLPCSTVAGQCNDCVLLAHEVWNGHKAIDHCVECTIVIGWCLGNFGFEKCFKIDFVPINMPKQVSS